MCVHKYASVCDLLIFLHQSDPFRFLADRVYLRDVTAVSPLKLLLFGRSVNFNSIYMCVHKDASLCDLLIFLHQSDPFRVLADRVYMRDVTAVSPLALYIVCVYMIYICIFADVYRYINIYPL